MQFLVTWIVLAVFWILLSGHWDAIHLTFGFFSVTLVAAISSPHLAEGSTVRAEGRRLLRVPFYVPWLIGQITVANVDVLLRVLGVRPVDPRILRMETDLETDFGRVTMANSITLTPGTVTIDVDEDGTFLVHAISPEAADTIREGDMARRVRRLETGEP